MIGYRVTTDPSDILREDPSHNFGFRFEDAANDLHYGWANINFDTVSGTVSITEWAYQSTPDTPIHIAGTGAVAVPLPTASSLGLLGLGAAGVMAWRKRRKDKAAIDA